jgi:hypothetical protein
MNLAGLEDALDDERRSKTTAKAVAASWKLAPPGSRIDSDRDAHYGFRDCAR